MYNINMYTFIPTLYIQICTYICIIFVYMHVYVHKYRYKKIYVYMIYVVYICVYIYIYIIDTYIYIYIYTFSSCLLQHCNIYYFVSQCMFSHAVHEQVFKIKFLTCFIDFSLLFNL